jgi:hypothetical protein
MSGLEQPPSNGHHPLELRYESGADDGIRTRDLRFTKPLLYQLSYVGIWAAPTCHPRVRVQPS